MPVVEDEIASQLAQQGIAADDWIEPAIVELARATNDEVRTVADRYMDHARSPGDFFILLAEEARRAEVDVDVDR
jgi:hypothetical protein